MTHNKAGVGEQDKMFFHGSEHRGCWEQLTQLKVSLRPPTVLPRVGYIWARLWLTQASSGDCSWEGRLYWRHSGHSDTSCRWHRPCLCTSMSSWWRSWTPTKGNRWENCNYFLYVALLSHPGSKMSVSTPLCVPLLPPTDGTPRHRHSHTRGAQDSYLHHRKSRVVMVWRYMSE